MKTNILTCILFRMLTCALSKRMRSFCATFILLFTVGINSAWGETIPAGTIIYVDVTGFQSDNSAYRTEGKYYMSVTAADNVDKIIHSGDVTGAAYQLYDARKDTEWQELRQLATNLYYGVVTNESTVGSVSFWRKDLGSSDALWEVDACTPNMWNSKERKFTIGSDKTHHDDRHIYGFSATTSMGLYIPGAPLYLRVNDSWKSGNPRFAACFKGASGEKWVDFSRIGETDYYSVTVPDGEWPYVIFCRMNAAKSENQWNPVGCPEDDRWVWDQTNDLFAQHDRNLCQITGWSYSQSMWVYSPTPLVVGAMNDWNLMRGSPIAEGAVNVHLNANTSYPFKVVYNESWYGDGDALHSLTFAGQEQSKSLTIDKNDVLLLTAGEGDYTFTWDNENLSVNYPVVTHPNPNYIYYKNTDNWTNVHAHLYGDKSTVFPGPQLNSFSFNGVPYHYVALGGNSSIVFNQGSSDNQKDLVGIGDNKGKYYNPSTSSWECFTARINLDSQGASTAGTENVDANIFFTTLDSKISCPERVGYIFEGYWTEENGLGVQLIEDDGDWIASVNGYTDENKKWINTVPTATLYAKWTANTTTVMLNANGGDSNSEVVATYDALLPVFDAVTRSGHVLTGYWTTATGGTLVINENGSYVENSGIWNRTDGTTLTLYAQWVSLTTPSVVADSAYYLGEPVAIRLHTVSTGVKESVVMFYVSDGTETYQVLAAPGSVGEAATEYSTAHSATFYATKAATYTVYAVLYEGKFIDNFEGMASAWSGLGYGECARVANIEREPANGSNKVMKIMRNTAAGSEVFNTAWTTTAEGSGYQSGWDFSYSYIHMRYYAPQPETPTVEYYDRDGVHRNTSVSAVSANTWHRLTFEVNGGVVDHIHPFVSSGVGNSIYIDDIILSNEAEMTAILTSESSAVTIKRPFVIYRTGDKADDPRKADDDVESYDGGTIDKLIEYRMRVRACDQWYTLCLPFDVQAVQVWDAEDGKYYDIVPYFRMNNDADATIYTGHYFIRKPNCENGADFPMSQFGDWKDPISASIPTGYRPTKNTPYIIQWHDPYFLNSYISFFGRAGQTIPSSMTQGVSPSADNVVRVYGNDAMKKDSVPGAYMLDAGYGNGAWLRGDDPTAKSVVLPFECYIRASSTATGKYLVIRRGMTIEDTATGWDDVLNSEYKSCIKVYTLAGFPVAQYDNCSFAEAAQRLRTCHHAGLYILRAGNESVKIMVGGK